MATTVARPPITTGARNVLVPTCSNGAVIANRQSAKAVYGHPLP